MSYRIGHLLSLMGSCDCHNILCDVLINYISKDRTIYEDLNDILDDGDVIARLQYLQRTLKEFKEILSNVNDVEVDILCIKKKV